MMLTLGVFCVAWLSFACVAGWMLLIAPKRLRRRLFGTDKPQITVADRGGSVCCLVTGPETADQAANVFFDKVGLIGGTAHDKILSQVRVECDDWQARRWCVFPTYGPWQPMVTISYRLE